MPLKRIAFLLLSCTLLFRVASYGQSAVDSISTKVTNMPSRLFDRLQRSTADMEKRLSEQTTKYLQRLQKKENKLKAELYKKDSVRAKAIFGDVDSRYAQLQNTSGQVSKYSAVYSAKLDSLSTSLSFLKNQQVPGMPANPQFQKTLAQFNSLQTQLNASDEVQKALQQRQQYLQEQLQQLGMTGPLQQFKAETYYYQAQVKAYQQEWEDPDKATTAVLGMVRQSSAFQSFFNKNSQLSSLFPGPSSSTAGVGAAVPAGIQTRETINKELTGKFGSQANISQVMQQSGQSAESQITDLKNKVNSLTSGAFGNGGSSGSGASSDQPMPNFKPNGQRTKTFLNRLEYGANIQTQRASSYFPVTSNIGAMVGYKLNDKSDLGLGLSYDLGWGTNWNNIKLTQQGLGLRSFVDWQIKNSWFLTGGYEENYMNVFTSIQQLKNYSAWQSSGLIGLSKQYRISKKLNGNLQLLWDFLSYQQIPKTQPILFRVGYTWH